MCRQCCSGCSVHESKAGGDDRCWCGNYAATGCDYRLCGKCCIEEYGGCSRHGDGGLSWQWKGAGQRQGNAKGDDGYKFYEGKKPQTGLRKFLRELPEFKLPKEYRAGKLSQAATKRLVHEGVLQRDKVDVRPVMNATNAKALLRELLWVEEAQLLRDIKAYDQRISRQLRKAGGGDGFYWIKVPGLLEKRPSVLRGDFVWVTQQSYRQSFKGWVHKVEDEHVCVHLPWPFDNSPPFDVRFSFPRVPYRNMHRALQDNAVDVFSKTENFELLQLRGAVTRCFNKGHLGSVLSSVGAWVSGQAQQRGESMDSRIGRLKERLNLEQVLFVEAVLAPVKKPFPVLCWGPPGTGKTTTICESIIELLRIDQGARCLVCCPSNAAVDVLCRRLAEGGVTERQMIRLNARSRRLEEVDASVRPFCPRELARGALGDDEAEWRIPKANEYEAFRIVLATCSFSATVLSCFPSGSPTLKELFSHCFIDEAGQTMEPEAWIPLCLLKENGKSFFIGDHRQLGSTVHNPFACKMGLEVSIQERLWETLGGGQLSNSTRCFALLKSYRSHGSILRLFNRPVYGGMLQCFTDPSTVRQFQDMGPPGGHPVIIHHVVGQERKLPDSPSWTNEAELDIVKQYVTAGAFARGSARRDWGDKPV